MKEKTNQTLNPLIKQIKIQKGFIDEILASNVDKVAEYKAGKEKMFAFFVGQTMKASKGSANPQKVNELIKERLSK